MTFQPELGQMGFSNTPWQEYDVPELAVAAIGYLSEEIEITAWNATQEVFHAPTGNVGGCFLTDTFQMRSYCWCDGGIHPEGCPPNFVWRDVRICWYKHLSRGTSCNQKLTAEIVMEMLSDCLAAVRALDEAGVKAAIG